MLLLGGQAWKLGVFTERLILTSALFSPFAIHYCYDND